MEIRWKNNPKQVTSRSELVKSHAQTVIGGRIKCFILIGVPGHNADKISDKRWNFTFQNCSIASNDVRFIDVGIVKLTDD